jgi:hypothetical protein
LKEKEKTKDMENWGFKVKTNAEGVIIKTQK